MYDAPQKRAMLDIGMQELLIVMVIALLVFGPYKLPELGRAVGRAMREFRRASDEFRSTIETNLNISETLDETLRESLREESPPSLTGGVTPAVGSPGPSEAAPGEAPASSPEAATLDLPVPRDPVSLAADREVEQPVGEPASVDPDAAPAVAAPLEAFWAQRGGRLLHHRTCGWAARIPEVDRIVFKVAGEAREVGLQPCPVCDPHDEEPTV